MELQIDINEKVVEWLASMGYPVAGMPDELLHGMLLREARQWQLSPTVLEDLIEEGARKSTHGATMGTNLTHRQAQHVHHPAGLIDMLH